MAHRCPKCGLVVPSEHGVYPNPDRLAALKEHLPILAEAAAEFERVCAEADTDEHWTAVDFIGWMSIDCERMAGFGPLRRAKVTSR